jgi:hypothetical protein
MYSSERASGCNSPGLLTSIEPEWCENGITVVRRLRVEEDHKIDVIWKSQT